MPKSKGQSNITEKDSHQKVFHFVYFWAFSKYNLKQLIISFELLGSHRMILYSNNALQ